MLTNLCAFVRDRRGATAVEYGLIASLIVVAMLAALGNTANSTINMWNKVGNAYTNANKR